MSEIAVAQTAPAGWGRKLVWGLGSAVVVGGVVPWMLALLAIGAGMFVVAPLVGLALVSPLADPRDVLANPTVAPAVIGIAVAFVTLGKHRGGHSA